MAVTEGNAVLDPPEIGAVNPIHAEGAKAYGFDGAVVGGISTYALACAAVVAELGDGWLDRGWAEVAFRAPVYVGEHLRTAVDGDGRLVQSKDDGTVTIDGRVGLGDGPWLTELAIPDRLVAEPSPDDLPWLDPAELPVGTDYLPMAIRLDEAKARRYEVERVGSAPEGRLTRMHPSWVPGRMTPLIRHSAQFGAGIHTSGLIQHLAPLVVPETYTVAARWVDSTERKGRWWSTTDAVILASDGHEVARCRQVAIILPKL